MRRAVFNMRDERPAWAPPPDFVERLRAGLGEGWELVDVRAPVSGRGDGGGVSAEAVEAMRGAEIYFGLGLPRAVLAAGLEEPGRLRWIHTGAAGVASLLHPELVASDIVLTNSAGIHARPIAESVLGMMLYFARGIDMAVDAQRQRRWSPERWETPKAGVGELAGATVGIVGLGGIGREVARKATALGMHVSAMSRSGEPDDAALVVTGADALEQLLAVSDYLVLTVPATAETRGLIGAAQLARLRPGSVLINVARGSVIDQDALVTALRDGRLRGAGLDVFAEEPLPEDSPLWGMTHVLITPHVSATTPHFWQREGDLMLDNVARYLEGRPLRNTVDTTAGY